MALRANCSLILNISKRLSFPKPSRNGKIIRETASHYSFYQHRQLSFANVLQGPKIHWETCGDPHPSLAPVFVAHGMMGSCTNWCSLAKSMNKKTGRQIVTYDARNHGLSGHTESMTYEEMSQDLLNVVKGHFHGDIAGRKVVLMGHSMGGRTVMYTALTNTDLVERLIVVDVSPVNIDFSTMDSSGWNMAHLFHTMRNVKFLQPNETEKWTISKSRQDADAQMSHRIKDPGLRMWLLMNMIQDEQTKEVKWRHNLDVIQHAFETDVRKFPNDELPEDIQYTGPTTFIGGADSEYIPVSDHPEILEKFPNAEFHYIQGAGHWVHSQKPHEFLEIVLKKL